MKSQPYINTCSSISTVTINECAANADSASKKVFEALVDDEERHFEQFDTELANIEKFGERYLALQSIERSKSMAGGVVAG